MLNKLHTSFGIFLALTTCMLMSFGLIGCGEASFDTNGEITDDPQVPENIETTDEVISLDDALDIAMSVGVDSSHLIYAEVLPLAISDEEAMMTWGFVEKLGVDDFRVTHIDRWTGEVLSVGEAALENIRDFLVQTGIGSLEPTLAPFAGSSPNSYDSFPWGYQLPLDDDHAEYGEGTTTLTRGYNYDTHRGPDYWATDWDPGNRYFNLESAASCWAIYTSYSSSYGYQFIGECGDAGGGKRYFFRAAHFDSPSPLVPGWWVNKDTYMGEMGNRGTGNGGYHVHFVVYRATSSSGGNFTNGESLPINKWPGSGDSICDRKFASYDFSGQPGLKFNIGSNGCP